MTSLQPIKFHFNADEEHQLIALKSTLDLFEGLNPIELDYLASGMQTIPNLPHDEDLDEEELRENLESVVRFNKEEHQVFYGSHDPSSQLGGLSIEDGEMLEQISPDSHRFPVFTIEMETGTGKTYVYFRSMYEMYHSYGFRKFIVVVPSVAIYQGVLKTFSITASHFASLYNSTPVKLIDFSNAGLGVLKDFAEGTALTIMVMTIDSFNKASNVIYKPTEKLRGGKLPYEYIQEARPIMILDEPQRYTSATAKKAIRTLKPLLALAYSATPPKDKRGNVQNVVYRLTPIDAFRRGLVKRIEVIGIEDMIEGEETADFLVLEDVLRQEGKIAAKVIASALQGGRYVHRHLTLTGSSNLMKLTDNEVFSGYDVENIDIKNFLVKFKNGAELNLAGGELSAAISKEAQFRAQIENTILTHIEKQAKLYDRGIKVLSLFFIDKVANYTSDEGIIRKVFDEMFELHKDKSHIFRDKDAKEVRGAYFAKKKMKSGDEFDVDLSDLESAEQKEAEKKAYSLIMRDKEKLIGFDESVSFIFAHSALKEGWDNPNVFQICTLNNTRSETKKRQEIGRGLRLCVDSKGLRVTDEDANILTVIANESYEGYVSRLQGEYIEDGEAQAPQKPSNARKGDALRRNELFNGAQFRGFWNDLIQATDYEIHFDTEKFIEVVVGAMNAKVISANQFLVTRGKFVMSNYKISLNGVDSGSVDITVTQTTTEGTSEQTYRNTSFVIGDRVSKIVKGVPQLSRYKIVRIIEGDEPSVEFGNGEHINLYSSIEFSTVGNHESDRNYSGEVIQTEKPIPNLLERVRREVPISTTTIAKIYAALKEEKRQEFITNPEGFIGAFVDVLKKAYSDHIANEIVYYQTGELFDFDMEELFPPKMKYPQKELVDGSEKSLYDKVQIDSDTVEGEFVENKLNRDSNMMVYFKFPPKFKIKVPKVIGNYNPDWGVVRQENKETEVRLVRETKPHSGKNLEYLHDNEKRKIKCAIKHFEQVGIRYKVVTGKDPDWMEN
jgi:type III restriction enzyme